VLLVEPLDLRDRVGGDAEHRGPRLQVVAAVLSHTAGLGGAAGRIGLRIKVDDDRLPSVVGQLDGASVLVGQLEVGGMLSGFDHADISCHGLLGCRAAKY
jgi:hypothetical protein